MSKFKKSLQDLFSSVFGRADYKAVLEDQWEYAESFDGNLLAAQPDEEDTGVPATVSMDDGVPAPEPEEKANLHDLVAAPEEDAETAATLHDGEGQQALERASPPIGAPAGGTASDDKGSSQPPADPPSLIPTDGIPHAAETSDLFAALAFNKPDAPYPDDVPVSTLVSGKHATLDETELFPPESDTVAALDPGATQRKTSGARLPETSSQEHKTAPAPLVLSNPIGKKISEKAEETSSPKTQAQGKEPKASQETASAAPSAKPSPPPAAQPATDGSVDPSNEAGSRATTSSDEPKAAPARKSTAAKTSTAKAPARARVGTKARKGPAKKEPQDLTEEELRASQVMAAKLRTDARKSRRVERTASVISPVKLPDEDPTTASGVGPQAMKTLDDATASFATQDGDDSGMTVFDWGVGLPPTSISDEDAIREELTLRLETLFDHLEDSLEEDILDLLIDSLEEHTVDLPPFPPTASKLVGKGGKAPDDEEVLEIVKTDPALAGNVVKVANSPFYMAAAQVSSLDSAIMRIGVNQVRRVALATVMGSSFEVEGFETVINSARLHSLATALCAEWLAEAFEVDPAQAFLAGLLHDAGELAVYRLLRHAYEISGNKSEPWKRNLPFVQGLARRYHPHLGALFVFSWELPASVANSLVYHHHPDAFEVEHSNLVRLIHAANGLGEISLRHGRSRTWQNSLEGWRDCTPLTGNMPTTGSDGVEELPIGPIRRLLPANYPSARVQKVIRSVLLRMDASELSTLKEDEIATLPPDQ